MSQEHLIVPESELADHQARIRATRPGSPEEKAAYQAFIAAKAAKTGEFTAVRNQKLEAETGENGVVRPQTARQLGQEALNHVTREHRIPTAHDLQAAEQIYVAEQSSTDRLL